MHPLLNQKIHFLLQRRLISSFYNCFPSIDTMVFVVYLIVKRLKIGIKNSCFVSEMYLPKYTVRNFFGIELDGIPM